MSVIEGYGKVYEVKCERTGETKVFTFRPKRCFVRTCGSYICVRDHGDRMKPGPKRIEANK